MIRSLICRIFHKWKYHGTSAICQNCGKIYSLCVDGWVEVTHFGD